MQGCRGAALKRHANLSKLAAFSAPFRAVDRNTGFNKNEYIFRKARGSRS